MVLHGRTDAGTGTRRTLMSITEQDIRDLIDRVTNAVDEWVRAGAGTYEELQAVVERAIRRIAEVPPDDPPKA